MAKIRVDIDWDGDSRFRNANSNVTDDLRQFSCVRGRDIRDFALSLSSPGRADLTLINQDGKYAFYNENSPLHGKVVAGVAVRIQILEDFNFIERRHNIWYGYINEISPQSTAVNQERVVRISCVGYLGRINRTQVTSQTALGTTPTAIIRDILTEAGVPSSRLDLDESHAHIARWAGARGTPADLAILPTAIEVGLLYEKKDGDIGFRNRIARLKNIRGAATFSDNPAVSGIGYKATTQQSPLSSVFNVFEARAVDVMDDTDTNYLVEATTFPASSPYRIPPQSSATFRADFSGNEEFVGISSWRTPTIIAFWDDGVTAVSPETFNHRQTDNSYEFSARNRSSQNAIDIRGVVFRGTRLRVQSDIHLTEQGVEIERYGERRYPIVPEFSDARVAQAWIRWVKRIWEKPFPMVTISWDCILDQEQPVLELVNRDLVTQVRIVGGTDSGLLFRESTGSDWFVERVHISGAMGSGGLVRLEVRYDMMPRDIFGLFFILGNSKLGVETKLG